MLEAGIVFSLLRAQGLRFFAGVPDSLLKDFCAFVDDNAEDDEHVITANEGNAVALASGHYLATGRPALVYMQNSGFGNAVNPLLSLADPEVYSVPMLLMVGWRGEPDGKDEPQHVKQGRVMTELLDAMEIPWFELRAETRDPTAVIDEACRRMTERSMPVALLVRKGTFEEYEPRENVVTTFPMNREGAVQCIVDMLEDDDVIVSTTGKSSRELYEYREERGEGHGNDFLTVGSMGHASSIAMGVARARSERKVICVDGDGSVLMHMGALAVIGQSGVPNFLHVVVNNGAHDSVGGQATVGFEIDIPAVAKACGYREVVSVSDAKDVKEAVARLHGLKGPVLLEVKVNKGARSDLGRPKTTPAENRDAFMKRLGSDPGPSG